MAKKNVLEEFNPVKEFSMGQKVTAVKWSTKVLQRAKDAIKKGLPLKANPFLNNDIQLLKPDLVFERTEEELEIYKRCMNDVVYFASFCYLMTPAGLKKCELRDYQVEYLKHLQINNFSLFLSCRLSGKSTTTAIECLWQIIFNYDYKGLILSKSGAAGRDLIKKIKDMYRYLPDFLKPGIYKWNVSEMAFDNNSGVYTEAFSETAGLGNTINFLILDEFAWCPASLVELFYNNVIPTVTTMPDAKVRIMSTLNGHNFFYQLWQLATVGDPKTGKKSGYGTFKVDWWQVPQFNKKTQCWEKRDEKWKQMMVGRLGTEENFDYQYGTNFYSSDKCILSRQRISKLHEGEVVYEPWFGLDHDSYEDQQRIKETVQQAMVDTVHRLGLEDAFMDSLFESSEEKDTDVASNILFLERQEGWEYDYNNDWIVILCDLAEGSGGDFTVFQILQWDGSKLTQRARWRANTVILEEAAGVLFYMCAKIFNQEHTIVSLEWNTYGAYFYKCLLGYLDAAPDVDFDTGIIVWYTKSSDDLSVDKGFKKKIPGLRFTASSKRTACMLIKNEFERENLIVNDIVTISEIENFEERGNSYAAVRGHDDTVMPLVQIPKLKETAKWLEFTEEYTEFALQGQGPDTTYNFFEDYNSSSIYQSTAYFNEEHPNDLITSRFGARAVRVSKN